MEDLARPTPASGEVLIHVQAIALNPVDELYVNNPIAAQEKRIIGTDFAGVVVEAAAEIHGSSDPRVKPGTRVAGFLQGGTSLQCPIFSMASQLRRLTIMLACSVNDRPGAFAEYIVIPYDLVWAVPDDVSLEEASTISMCGLTAAQALFVRLGLPSPFPVITPSRAVPVADPTINVFVYGSSTSVGLYAAQLAHTAAATSGRHIRLIGAASSSKHDMLREKPYSYDVLVDYRDKDWVEKVKSATNGNGVDFALDCISEKGTVYNTQETLAPTAKFAVIRGPVGGEYDPAQMSVKPMYGAVWEGLGVEVGYNGEFLDKFATNRAFLTFITQGPFFRRILMRSSLLNSFILSLVVRDHQVKQNWSQILSDLCLGALRGLFLMALPF